METLAVRLARIGVCSSAVTWCVPFGTDIQTAYAAIQKEQYGGHALTHLATCLTYTLTTEKRDAICVKLLRAFDIHQSRIWEWRDRHDDTLARIARDWKIFLRHNSNMSKEDVAIKHADVKAKVEVVSRAAHLHKLEIYAEYTAEVCAILPVEIMEHMLRKFELLPKEWRSRHRMNRYTFFPFPHMK
jgi:hypothetical protein